MLTLKALIKVAASGSLFLSLASCQPQNNGSNALQAAPPASNPPAAAAPVQAEPIVNSPEVKSNGEASVSLTTHMVCQEGGSAASYKILNMWVSMQKACTALMVECKTMQKKDPSMKCCKSPGMCPSESKESTIKTSTLNIGINGNMKSNTNSTQNTTNLSVAGDQESVSGEAPSGESPASSDSVPSGSAPSSDRAPSGESSNSPPVLSSSSLPQGTTLQPTTLDGAPPAPVQGPVVSQPAPSTGTRATGRTMSQDITIQFNFGVVKTTQESSGCVPPTGGAYQTVWDNSMKAFFSNCHLQ